MKKFLKKNIDEYIIDEEKTRKLESYLTTKFDRIIALIGEHKLIIFNKKDIRDTAIEDLDEKKVLSSIYFPLVSSLSEVRTPIRNMIFDNNLLQQLGIGIKH